MANKAREWLDGDGDKGLADWDISRDEPYFGIPIPDAPGKYFYVWLDAPIGYLASLRRTWPGRGLTSPPSLGIPTSSRCISSARTSCTTTRCSGRQCSGSLARPISGVPDHVYVHGFITVSGEKMSKSRGTGVSPDVYLDLGLDPEWLRYYIAAKLNAKVEDIDFNPDDFLARINSDLIGKYVNIASRAAPFSPGSSGQARHPRRERARAHQPADDGAEDAESAARRLRGARVRARAARGDAHRRSTQRGVRRGAAFGFWRRTRRNGMRCRPSRRSRCKGSSS